MENTPVENKVESVQTIPFAMLEVLVYGNEDDKAKIKKMMDNIQEQMYKCKKGKYARILWYIDKGEKTEDEKKQWLIDNCNAKYYVFAPDTHTVKPDWVKNTLNSIKKFEDSLRTMQSYNVLPSRKKPESKKETNLSVVK